MTNRTPELGAKSFSCPHCSALAHQFWYWPLLRDYDKDDGPWVPHDDAAAMVAKSTTIDLDQKPLLIEMYQQMLTRKPFYKQLDNYSGSSTKLMNSCFSRCYACNGFCIWVFDDLVYPAYTLEVRAADDMPLDVRNDFEEAVRTINVSPRGAAALSRLSIQKLCVYLGGDGVNLNTDIASLVKKGLSTQIQQALDIVRVIGNNAVHPGVLDLKDDRETALKLLKLVNVIVESQITQPKAIDVMFGELPEGARKGIEARDRPKN